PHRWIRNNSGASTGAFDAPLPGGVKGGGRLNYLAPRPDGGYGGDDPTVSWPSSKTLRVATMRPWEAKIILLGGATRETIPVYNTCAGYHYVRTQPVQSVANWGLPDGNGPAGAYEDLEGFLTRAGDVAESLLEQGIRAMKIWPFDLYAEASQGSRIAPDDLRNGLEPFRQVRSAVGAEMDVMIELHGLWEHEPVQRIVAACDELSPRWYEDPLGVEDVEGLAALATRTATPLAVGETVAGLGNFRRLCEYGAAGVVVFDAGWCGGLTEARKVAAVAESHALPVAAHDCTGPVGFTAGTHLSAALPNASIQEFVRAHHSTWYGELVSGLPPVEDGAVRPPDAPGLGVQLREEALARPDARLRSSGLGAAAGTA
ncbi:MAG TPA: mandelate racemase/muconate lactonizing enzyme family protein, partial [Solirubrobacteraceae bacterium]|nr:mandelate racemase/muconate lactonizing enzyme family protein [Solirubrobacteraceae bacterium]